MGRERERETLSDSSHEECFKEANQKTPFKRPIVDGWWEPNYMGYIECISRKLESGSRDTNSPNSLMWNTNMLTRVLAARSSAFAYTLHFLFLL